MCYISVVSPVYGCKDCLYELYYRLKETLEKISEDYEIVLVNDASPDGAWDLIEALSKKDTRVKGINLSKNFGQHNAITAGLDHCNGEWVIVMDCDLQDRPEEIYNLYSKAKEGFDFVLGKRSQRQDKWVKKLYSKAFNELLSYLTDSKIDASVANFGIFRQNVIESINLLREKTRWFPSFINWVGFNGVTINVVHGARPAGGSSYTFGKLLNLALDVIILNSNKPLRLVIKSGLLISFLAIIYACITVYKYLDGQVSVLGWTSVIISIWFLSGVIIFISGIIGLYVSKIYDHSKNRPLYIVKEKTF